MASVPYLAMLSGYSGDFFRVARPDGQNSDFYEIQARALLDGRLAVPEGSLGPEAFVVGGEHFMYFPPFPALLRMPHMLVTDAFDGHFTTVSLFAAWVLTAVALALLLWRVRQLLAPDQPVGRFEVWFHGGFVLVALGGSVWLHLAALPWVYHESYAWGIAGALWALFALVGYVARPSTWDAVAFCAWTTVAVLSRSTAGWACAGAALLAALWIAAGRRGKVERCTWWPLVVAGLLPVAIGAVVNWAKFRHPFMFPIEDQIWSQISPLRQRALAANDGSLTGIQFLATTFVSYLRPDGIRFTSLFPFITLPAEPADAVGGVQLDESYRTGSVSAFMPGMVGLTVWGAIVAVRCKAVAARGLCFALLGAAAIPAGVLLFGYVAHRYTAEFFVLLAVGGSVGGVDVARRIDALSVGRRRILLGVGAAVLVFGVVANSASAFQVQSVTARGKALERLVGWQQAVSSVTGEPLDGFVVKSDVPPADAPADALWVHGPCDGLFLATGETYMPWVPVESAEVRLAVELPTDDVERVTLLAFTYPGPAVLVEQRAEGTGRQARLAVDVGDDVVATPWATVDDGAFDVTLRGDVDSERYEVFGPSGEPLTVPMTAWRDAFVHVIVPGSPSLEDRAAGPGGLGVTRSTNNPTPLCAELGDAGAAT